MESYRGQGVDRSNVNPYGTLAEGKAVFPPLLLDTFYEISKHPKRLSSKWPFNKISQDPKCPLGVRIIEFYLVCWHFAGLSWAVIYWTLLQGGGCDWSLVGGLVVGIHRWTESWDHLFVSWQVVSGLSSLLPTLMICLYSLWLLMYGLRTPWAADLRLPNPIILIHNGYNSLLTHFDDLVPRVSPV